MFKKTPPPVLTAQQIAAVTGCVPMTGVDTLDIIITASLRLRIATEFMGNLLGTGGYKSYEIAARESLKATDALINAFQEGPTNAKAPKT